VFLSRLLFCFFAEDTGIFAQSLFTDSVASNTQADGSDLSLYLERLFTVLNTKEEHRAHDLLHHFQNFPYVNGGLFRKSHWIPQFSAKSHRIIIECGELDWKEINPDIFGSMMQAVTHPGQRASLGMHYTSVPNIMKVIEPLFLDELKAEFEKHRGNAKKLQMLLARMGRIKFFDPACGSGNFLIITYKELRRLEMDIIRELGSLSLSSIHLEQFYGIEIDDFAHTIARLSLYLAEHQMNTEFFDRLGRNIPTLPLKESGNIVCGNATRLDWETICPKHDGDEIYILGNPPYLGARMQNKEQKGDIDFVFSEFKKYRDLDYISCWFFYAARYARKESKHITGNGRLLDYSSVSELPFDFSHVPAQVKFAFVSTNSVCQGEQVSLLWPKVLRNDLEIFFAHQSFKWGNLAKKNAGVTVVIIGIRSILNEQKKIYKDGLYSEVKNISPYLTSGSNDFVWRRNNPLSDFPRMFFGNMPNDGGFLILNIDQKENIEREFPESKNFFKKLLGSLEFLRGSERWCLWIEDENLHDAAEIPPIADRIEKVRMHRLNSKDRGTNKLSKRSHQFRDLNKTSSTSIIIPRVSSERREYIPCGFLDSSIVISDSAQAIYDAKPWIFGVISSRMHMTWVRAVAGRLKTDYRYSSALCYNTFPIPTLTAKQKEEITRHVYNVLEEREKHSEKTMAQLYDPEKMPQGLKEAHHSLDAAIERIYRSRPFTSDEERLEYLFDLYSRMIGEDEKK
jgi:type II restriction/modification system DNA methylase subunit YeeA